MAAISDGFVLVIFGLCAAFVAEARWLNMFVRHFEPLSYEPLRVHRDHVRLRRSVDQHRRGHVYLRFQGFNRLFNLKLRPDTSVFHKDLVMETQSHGRVKPEINHIYAGELVGEPSSHVYGALLDGVFQGSIQSAHGRYYVEKAQPYFRRRQPFHSVLYDSRDVRYPARTGAGGWCGVTPDTERWMYDVMRRRSPGPQPSHRHIRMASNLRTHIHEYRDRGDRWTGRKPLWEAGAEDEGAEDEQQRVDVPAKNASARMSTRTSRRVCNLKLSVDHLLYGALHDEGSSAPRTRKAITGLVASHVNRASGIFRRTNFGGIQDISFIVHKIVVNDSRSCAEGVKQTNPFCSDAIDAPYLLHLTSRENNDDFCLAYTWTYRDFADGVLGLAWIAKAQLGQGGICEKNRPSVDTKPGTNEYQQYHLSLNTGIITFVNYNSFISFAVSEVTFAHELGHNFGSPHDAPPGVSCFGACAPCGARGNYIMFPSATRGSQLNNDKFSPCSIRNITEVLVPMFEGTSNRENCFQADSGPICGNAIVEGDEVCDCGLVGAECGEQCCYPRQNSIGAPGCTLRKGAICSPSAGPCCDTQCSLLDSTAMCSTGGACRNASFCDGRKASCPLGDPVADLSECNNGTQVCMKGECAESICIKYNLTQCTLRAKEYPADELCLVACEDADGCRPACDFPVMKSHCGVRLTPGSPCNGLRGFCDVFSKCRDVDAEGPLTRLNRIFFGEKSINKIKAFITRHPLLSAFLTLGSVWLMILVFRCLAVHTPSSNPKKKPAYKLKYTLKHPWSV